MSCFFLIYFQWVQLIWDVIRRFVDIGGIVGTSLFKLYFHKPCVVVVLTARVINFIKTDLPR
jgi:hypothetical protein